MRFRDQKKFFEALKRYERKFAPEEAKKYKMMKKRHSDDEDLDNQSFAFLKELYNKYYVNRTKPNLDDLLKFTPPENNEQSE